MLLLAGCKEKGSFSNVEIGESWLCRLVFEDESFKDYAVTADVLYAGEDTSSRYKMVFYMPEGWRRRRRRPPGPGKRSCGRLG